MSFTIEDLETNSFYNALETKHSNKFKDAQKKLWLICVPIQKSIDGIKLSQEFINFHILKPSPFFKSHFITTDSDNSTCFEIENDIIKTNSGSVKILAEETAYNEDYRPYRIVVIEKPLCDLSNEEEDVPLNKTTTKVIYLSLHECSSFLMSFPECVEVMKTLDKKIQVFNSSYMILPHYLQDASLKLRNIIKSAEGEFIRSLIYRPSDEYSKVEINAALENYVLFHVHDKIFPVIKKFYFTEDEKITEKFLLLYDSNVTPDQLGVRDSFCCQTPSAVVELASLNSRKSPAEKLNCIMSTLELLKQDIEHFLSDSSYPVASKDIPCLTSDDLIPLLVNVIIQARPQFLVSNLHYIQNFCWENSPADKLSFGLVTFQAAKEFLKSYEFKHMKLSSKKIKKEISLEELMEVTVEIQNNKKLPVLNSPAHHQTPTDHLLENVTKMIEASTSELREWSLQKEPSTIKANPSFVEKPQQNAGDFLSSLRQSSLGLSYGKQS